MSKYSLYYAENPQSAESGMNLADHRETESEAYALGESLSSQHDYVVAIENATDNAVFEWEFGAYCRLT